MQLCFDPKICVSRQSPGLKLSDGEKRIEHQMGSNSAAVGFSVLTSVRLSSYAHCRGMVFFPL